MIVFPVYVVLLMFMKNSPSVHIIIHVYTVVYCPSVWNIDRLCILVIYTGISPRVHMEHKLYREI